jgi:hypothetical protein
MSVLAAGKTYGIAPNANLFLVKTKAGYRKHNGELGMAGVQPIALHWIFRTVKVHIEARLGRNENARSVINMSWGKWILHASSLRSQR